MPGKYDPINPVAFGAPVACPNDVAGSDAVLAAYTGSNRTLIEEVRRLWIAPDDLVMDVTYGRGAFWGNPPLPAVPQIRHDLAYDGVDCRSLPEQNESVDVVVFDPPYRAQHGGTMEGTTLYRTYRLAENGLDSINDVLDLYTAGIKEAARVLRPGGRILVKCADLSYSSRLHLVHLDVLRSLVHAGFELADMFILVNTSRANHNKNTTRQERARRNHSYLLVGALPKPVDIEPLTIGIEKLVKRFGSKSVEHEMSRLVHHVGNPVT